MGLPTALVDQLLAVYFTHVHVGLPIRGEKLMAECLAVDIQAVVSTAHDECASTTRHACHCGMRCASVRGPGAIWD